MRKLEDKLQVLEWNKDEDGIYVSADKRWTIKPDRNYDRKKYWSTTHTLYDQDSTWREDGRISGGGVRYLKKLAAYNAQLGVDNDYREELDKLRHLAHDCHRKVQEAIDQKRFAQQTFDDLVSDSESEEPIEDFAVRSALAAAKYDGTDTPLLRKLSGEYLLDSSDEKRERLTSAALRAWSAVIDTAQDSIGFFELERIDAEAKLRDFEIQTYDDYLSEQAEREEVPA